MKKSDILISLIIGEISAWLIIFIVKNLTLSVPYLQAFPIVFPLLCLMGFYLAWLISKKISVFYQIAKFVLVGGFNTLVDFGVLNFLMLLSGLTSGIFFTFFKGLSFLSAVINSYLWNKFWTFQKKETRKTGKEFLQFLVVSGLGLGINISIASFVVNVIGPQAGISAVRWANIGAMIATAVSMIWNFLGYKFIVFKAES